MTYTNPDPDPYPETATPAEWLEKAYDSGWMHRNSTTANRGYMANFREDHRIDECTPYCSSNSDLAYWPIPASGNSRILRPDGGELYKLLMAEDLPTLSPLRAAGEGAT